MKKVLILIGGILFGAGLAVSGMTDPAKVIGFLDFAGDWDPTLAFVMGGALLVFGIGFFALRKTGQSVCSLPDMSSDPICRKMVIGSAIFGIGWGLAGFCPGPALANLSTLRTDVLVFVPMMFAGMIIAQRTWNLDS